MVWSTWSWPDGTYMSLLQQLEAIHFIKSILVSIWSWHHFAVLFVLNLVASLLFFHNHYLTFLALSIGGSQQLYNEYTSWYILDESACYISTCVSVLVSLAMSLLESATLPSASSLSSASGRQRSSLPSATQKQTAKKWQTAKKLFAVRELFAVCQQTAKNLCRPLADGKERWPPPPAHLEKNLTAHLFAVCQQTAKRQKGGWQREADGKEDTT